MGYVIPIPVTEHPLLLPGNPSPASQLHTNLGAGPDLGSIPSQDYLLQVAQSHFELQLRRRRRRRGRRRSGSRGDPFRMEAHEEEGRDEEDNAGDNGEIPTERRGKGSTTRSEEAARLATRPGTPNQRSRIRIWECTVRDRPNKAVGEGVGLLEKA